MFLLGIALICSVYGVYGVYKATVGMAAGGAADIPAKPDTFAYAYDFTGKVLSADSVAEIARYGAALENATGVQAIAVVVEAGLASTSLLQRRLKVGYARAARLVDEMEEKGIVGPFEGSKPRKVLLTKEQYYERKTMSAD